jgi:hypothetical protein
VSIYPTVTGEAAETFVDSLTAVQIKHLSENLKNVLISSEALFAIKDAIFKHYDPGTGGYV